MDLREEENQKISIFPTRDEGGFLAKDSEHVARILNTNFASVFTIENTESFLEGAVLPGVTPTEISTRCQQDLRHVVWLQK